MDTAICTFATHAEAERARDRLLAAGFAPHDVHLEHTGRHVEGSRDEELRHRGGMEHEIALSPTVVERVTGFFGRMFGAEHPHTSTYAGHVDSGRTVLLIDAHQTGDVERARTVLEGERAAHYDVVDRTGGEPMRDILAEDVQPASTEAARAGSPARSTDWTRGTADRPTADRDVHATATGDGDLENVNIQGAERAAAQRGESMEPAGMRPMDPTNSDKPAANRDGLGRTRKDE